MSTEAIVEQIKNLQALMDAAFEAGDEAREAGDHDEADRQYELARGYESRINRRKHFLEK